MTKRNLALFGGTFDPIHLGHTTVAAAAAKNIGADELIFVPAKQSPLKDPAPKATDSRRFEMIALAIAHNKNFHVSDYELSKPKPSYTLETVRHFQADYGPNTSIYWLVGADSADELPRWYGIEKLIDQCNLCLMYRAGFKPPDFAPFTDIWGPHRVQKLHQNIIKTPLIDISSTQIRDRLAAGLDVSNMLHPPVEDYIRKLGLYMTHAES